MSKYKEAADVLKRQAVKYESLMSAAAALDDIGSLEQAAAENQKAAAEAVEAANRARAELDSINAEIEQAKTKRADKIKETEGIVAKAIFEANEKATAILAEAETQAQKIKFDATNQAQLQANGVARQIHDLNATKAKLASDVAEMQNRARIATDEAVEAEKRLAKVKESIAKLATA